MYRKWDEDEINLLYEYYPITTDDNIVKYFNNRTLNSIKVKAKKLKIYRKDSIKYKNRSRVKKGCKNPMYGKISNKKNKTYDEYYGQTRSKKIRNNISRKRKGSKGLKGDKNPMYGKIPYNKGKKADEKTRKKIKEAHINYWQNLDEHELKKRKDKLREEWLIKRDKYPEIDTLPEKITENLLIKMNVNYLKKLNIGYYNCDFVINKIIIEVQGDYWHGNPIFYDKFDKIQTKNNKRDIIKKRYLTNLGYYVIYLWEYDLKNNITYCEELLLKNLKNKEE